jgi:outer membrane protease
MNTMFAILPLALALGITSANAATFDGNTCLGDCSGHQAGYDWAEQNDVDDESSCSTPSTSFNQGCESYVEENAASVSDEEDNEEEDE